jgi:hypothetical protein
MPRCLAIFIAQALSQDHFRAQARLYGMPGQTAVLSEDSLTQGDA